MVVFSLRRWASSLPTGFLVSCGTPELRSLHTRFAYGTFTPFGRPFQTVRLLVSPLLARPYPAYISTRGLGSFPFARHYSGNRFYFLLLRVLRCFSSPGSLPIHYFIRAWIPYLPYGEFPHSDIYGSRIICISP